MTKLLNDVMKRVSELPDSEQDAVASIILEEVEDEGRWQASFAISREALARLAAGARREIERGDVLDFDPASKPK